MRRSYFALAAGLLAVAAAVVLVVPGSPVAAAINKQAHVHDDYYHPVGAFIVGPGTDHNLAMAACQVANPPSTCNTVIQEGDSVTWVAPSPFAVNVHTVTECSSNTFSVCGTGSSPGPIDDSGPRNPPLPGPSQWPYGPITFANEGTYYYRCEVHPTTMRGRVVVLGPVGGVVELPYLPGGDASLLPYVLGTIGVALVLGAGGSLARRRAGAANIPHDD